MSQSRVQQSIAPGMFGAANSCTAVQTSPAKAQPSVHAPAPVGSPALHALQDVDAENQPSAAAAAPVQLVRAGPAHHDPGLKGKGLGGAGAHKNCGLCHKHPKGTPCSYCQPCSVRKGLIPNQVEKPELWVPKANCTCKQVAQLAQQGTLYLVIALCVSIMEVASASVISHAALTSPHRPFSTVP